VLQIQRSIGECIARVEFASVAPDQPVTDAVAAMLEKSTACALVIDGGALVGIFTERDFLNRVSAGQRDPKVTPVRAVMTPEPLTLREHDNVAYAINRMAEGGFRHVPIVDGEGRPTSVLDVRVVMLHLVKVFAERERDGQRGDGEVGAEWIDIGGGG
jgi:CBS domain-containing protein